jgi:hypothetical protein
MKLEFQNSLAAEDAEDAENAESNEWESLIGRNLH